MTRWTDSSMYESVITTVAGRAAVRVIFTDEDRMIAETVCHVLGLD